MALISANKELQGLLALGLILGSIGFVIFRVSGLFWTGVALLYWHLATKLILRAASHLEPSIRRAVSNGVLLTLNIGVFTSVPVSLILWYSHLQKLPLLLISLSALILLPTLLSLICFAICLPTAYLTLRLHFLFGLVVRRSRSSMSYCPNVQAPHPFDQC